MLAITQNPNDKGSGMSLQDSNMTGTTSGASWFGVRAYNGKWCGKIYWEVGVYGSSANNVSVGVANTLQNLSGKAGDSASTGFSQFNGGYSRSISAPALVLNDVVMIAFDIDNGKIWFGKNGVWNQGNPATGTNPIVSDLVPQLWFPCISAVSGGLLTARFKNPTNYPVPTGFKAFDTTNATMIYRSTDTSAPQITGQAGKLITLLDACLVNGYGQKLGLGWSKPLSGTNLASYQMPVGTSQSFLAIDDSPAQAPRVRGFRTMTAAGPAAANGTYPFPNEYQLGGGSYYYKSSTADAAVRPWTLISNGSIFYLQIDAWTNGTGGRTMVFGDISSYVPSDQNPCCLIAMNSDNKSRIIQAANPMSACTTWTHTLAMRYDGLQNSVAFGKFPMRGICGMYDSGLSTGVYLQTPDPIYGGLPISPVYVTESYGQGAILRGWLPGFQWSCTSASFNPLDTLVGPVGSDIEGRSFEAYGGQNDAGYGWYFIETSDTQSNTRQR